MAPQLDSHITSTDDTVAQWETLFGSSEEAYHKVEGGLGCECAACCGADVDHETTEQATATADASLGAMPVFTIGQVADQLTSGYWSAMTNGSTRSFDFSAGEALNVDLSGLREEGQVLARLALDAWSAVSGLNFVELTHGTTFGETHVETFDAASGTATNYSMSVGDRFLGTLAAGGDRDAVGVDLVAGQTYTISLRGDHTDGSANADPYLRLLNTTGATVSFNDDAMNRDSRLTFTATSSGTYFVQAGSYQDRFAGDYSLEVAVAAGDIHISFGDQASGAYATSQVMGDTIISSHVNVNSNWSGGEYRTDGYHFQTYLHEIGHALGLGHAGNYNGGAVFGQDNHYQNDSWAVSVMSYFHQEQSSTSTSSFAYAITPMAADIVAIQSLYGAPAISTVDTTYGRDANTGTHLDGALDFAAPTAWTVADSGGTDHFDFSDFSQDQRIDLRDGASSDVGGLTGNVSIALGTIIEKATTGAGNDNLRGGASDNHLRGGAGHDRIFGGIGNDTLHGDDGEDFLEGGEGADDLHGGTGDDIIFGDGVTVDTLQNLFPSWTPPAEAAAHILAGDSHLVWDSIQNDFFEIA